MVGAERLQRGEDEDLVLVVRREADHHNTALAAITTTLQAAIHTTAVRHPDCLPSFGSGGIRNVHLCTIQVLVFLFNTSTGIGMDLAFTIIMVTCTHRQQLYEKQRSYTIK